MSRMEENLSIYKESEQESGRKKRHVTRVLTRTWTVPRAAAAAAAAGHHHDIHNHLYYVQCAVGGVVSSSIRWVLTPLEVIKGYMQVYPQKYPSMGAGLQTLWRTQGTAGLFKGLAPTAMAYACQTGTKYSLYESFKDSLLNNHGVADTSNNPYARGLVYVTAAAGAEACADILMCPFEQARVKTQVSNTTKSNSLMQTMAQELRAPFRALIPLWCRQVPGTVANFYAFENIVELLYSSTLLSHKPKESYSKTTQLAVTFVSGYCAGFLSAVVSHPADSLISLYCQQQQQQHNNNLSLRQIVRQTGLLHLATKGLVPRMLMTGTIIGFQWWIYDSFKTAMGMGTTGGGSHHRRGDGLSHGRQV